MTFGLRENLDFCEWLIERGLSLEECADVLCDMSTGDAFASALIRVFINRKNKKETSDAKSDEVDWGNPITP